MTTSRLSSPSSGSVVLDTNVLSELMRAQPDAGVRTWLLATPPAAVHTTAVTIAEVRFGIARLPAGRRRDELAGAFNDVVDAYVDRILGFDLRAAEVYADVVVEREGAGRPISGFDAQIAAVCRSWGCALATRNTDDFEGLGLDLIDPWQFEI